MSDRTPPLEGQVLRHSELKGISSGPMAQDPENRVANLDEATVITSEVSGSDMHKVVLDIDMPVKAIESSTPGHYHLFIDKELDWSDYSRLLWVLADIGIIEEGYAASSAERGYTAVRLPWVKKVKNTLKQMAGRVVVNGVDVGRVADQIHPLMREFTIDNGLIPTNPIRLAAPPRLNDGYYRAF